MPDEPKHTRFIRVQSDGPGSETLVTDVQGRLIEGVTDATIYLDPKELTQVSLTIIAPTVDVHGVVTGVTLVCPFCAEYESHDCPPRTIGGS